MNTVTSEARKVSELLRGAANALVEKDRRIDFLTQLSSVQGDKLRIVEGLLGLHSNQSPVNRLMGECSEGPRHPVLAEKCRELAASIEKLATEVEQKKAAVAAGHAKCGEPKLNLRPDVARLAERAMGLRKELYEIESAAKRKAAELAELDALLAPNYGAAINGVGSPKVQQEGLTKEDEHA